MPSGAIYEMNWLHSECRDLTGNGNGNRFEWNGIWIPELRLRYDELICMQPAGRMQRTFVP